ncbi:hypothetical protein CRE_09032 [Caenorhabditis remanei]|uniref:F-box domain-containing protein n=1 Tax=Caenorhabditis remanei TaxID=31234 RepID=E3LIW6_CAERE|nr:hypothetical protein CRE_09032 [Caenorhabditis remanei]
MTTLIHIPDVPLNLVLDYLDVRSIQVLRKVCRNLRNYIDDEKNVDPNILTIDLLVFTNVISLRFKDSRSWEPRTLIEYQRHPDGCLVVHFSSVGRRERLIAKQYFVKIFCMDFESILRHQKTVIQYLYMNFVHCIRNGKEVEQDLKLKPVASRFFTNFKEILQSRSHPLPVEEINMNIVYQKEVMSVLPFLDSTLLKYIIFLNARNRGRFFKTDEIIYLEQWKKAKELVLINFAVQIPLKSVFHAAEVHIELKKLTARDLYRLKKAFLKSRRARSFYIGYQHKEDDAKVVELLGTPYDDFENIMNDLYRRRRWFFRIPNNDRQALCIHFEDFSKFLFNRIKISEVSSTIDCISVCGKLL